MKPVILNDSIKFKSMTECSQYIKVYPSCVSRVARKADGRRTSRNNTIKLALDTSRTLRVVNRRNGKIEKSLSNLSVVELAKQLSCKPSTIYGYIYKNNHPSYSISYKSAKINKRSRVNANLFNVYKDGDLILEAVSVKDIASHFSIDLTVVYQSVQGYYAEGVLSEYALVSVKDNLKTHGVKQKYKYILKIDDSIIFEGTMIKLTNFLKMNSGQIEYRIKHNKLINGYTCTREEI